MGDICSLCCGAEREVSVTCPFECEFLQEARRHEKPAPINPADVPNQDVRLTEKFVDEHEGLLSFLGKAIAVGASDTPGAVDLDAREALEALIRTYRTLESGMYYESVPSNPLAAHIYRIVQEALAEFRKSEHQQLGISRTRDTDVLGLLVFFQRVERSRNNGRPRGRSFLDSLRGFYTALEVADSPSPSSLILP
jgi:hypothetical protein